MLNGGETPEDNVFKIHSTKFEYMIEKAWNSVYVNWIVKISMK